MDPAMIGLSVEIAVALGFTLFALLCVALVIAGLPGAWIMIAAAVVIDFTDQFWLPQGAPLTFHPITIVVAIAIAGIGELLELLLSAAGAKKFGASRAGMIGSIVGGVIGALGGTVLIPIPVVGTIVGALAGTAIGAVVGELNSGRKSLRETARPATGAVIGRVLGTLAKLPCAAAVLLILGVAAFVR